METRDVLTVGSSGSEPHPEPSGTKDTPFTGNAEFGMTCTKPATDSKASSQKTILTTVLATFLQVCQNNNNCFRLFFFRLLLLKAPWKFWLEVR